MRKKADNITETAAYDFYPVFEGNPADGAFVIYLGNNGRLTAGAYVPEEGVLEGSTELQVTKELTGRDWTAADAFTFTLTVGDEATRQAAEEGAVILPDNAGGLVLNRDR